MTEIRESAPRRTDRRKQRTRRQLLDAAVNLLLEKGYEHLVTDEISDRADIGRRTFYNHFVNKRDCVVEALRGRFGQYAAQQAQDLPGDEEGRDEAVVVATMAYRVFLDIARDPVTERLTDYPNILSEAIAESQRDYLTLNLARGLAGNRLRPALPLESLEPVLAWGFVGLVIASIGRASQEEDARAWAAFVLQNFGLEEPEVRGIVAGVSE